MNHGHFHQHAVHHPARATHKHRVQLRHDFSRLYGHIRLWLGKNTRPTGVPTNEGTTPSSKPHNTRVIADYQLSSTERFQHLTNEMFMNGSSDAEKHLPLMCTSVAGPKPSRETSRRPRTTTARRTLGSLGTRRRTTRLIG